MGAVLPNSGANRVAQFKLSPDSRGRQYWNGKIILPKIFQEKGFKKIILSLDLQHNIRKPGDVLEVFDGLDESTPFTMTENRKKIEGIETLAQVLSIFKNACVETLTIKIFRDKKNGTFFEGILIYPDEKPELVAWYTPPWCKI